MTELIVFTNTGATFKFGNVENFEYTTKGFKFQYLGVSTGVKRTANFDNTSTVGYAITQKGEK